MQSHFIHKNLWRIVGSIIAVAIVIIIGILGYGSYLKNNDLKPTRNITPQSSTTTLQFPETLGGYQDFAITDNADALASASGTVIIGNLEDGFSISRLPRVAITMQIPFGWKAMGGSTTLDRIDFYPSDEHYTTSTLPAIDLGIKVLDATALGTSDIHGVLSQVEEIITQSGQTYNSPIVDETNHLFAIETINITSPLLSSTSNNYAIYIKDPDTTSPLWVELDLRAPVDQYEKYLGLLGLTYPTLDIDWATLKTLVTQAEQRYQ